MTAESTVPSPGGQTRDLGLTSVSIMPPRGSGAGFRFPARRPPARPASPVPLLT
ncbi:transferase, partial [Streptomyces sp. RP5T]